MRRKRYMIVDHPAELDTQHIDTPGTLVARLSIHTLLYDYHWSRLDDKTVVVVASYPAKHHEALTSHPSVTMLPSEASSKTIKVHLEQAKNTNHSKALAPHLEDNHTMSDLVETLEQRFGTVFSLDR